MSSKHRWEIRDWANNLCFDRETPALGWECSEDAEEFLEIKLGDDFDTDRGEYYVVIRKS